MNGALYKHVLFKDLKDYIKRTDYFEGYTPTEKAWVRKNLGISSSYSDDSKTTNLPYLKLLELILNKKLIIGELYLITDFLTIYSSSELNDEGLYITWGLDINPSKKYQLLTMACTHSDLMSNVIVISNDPKSLLWNVKYNVKSEVLSDGVTTKGKITYLEDENLNSANFDFKNMLFNNGYTFLDLEGNENSDNCYRNILDDVSNITFVGNCSNNCISGNNIKIDVPVNNLYGIANNIHIKKDIIGMSTPNFKQFVEIGSKQYIDYLDSETLTHQFYELDSLQ